MVLDGLRTLWRMEYDFGRLVLACGRPGFRIKREFRHGTRRQVSDLVREAMRELGQLGIVAEQHDGLRLRAKLANDAEQVIRSGRVKPLFHHNIRKLVIKLLGYDLCGLK